MTSHQNIQEKLQKLGPILLQLEEKLSIVAAAASKGYKKGRILYDEVYASLTPYQPDELLKVVAGFMMMFFGGFFMNTVAVYEACSQSSADEFVKNLKLIDGELSKARKASIADDQKDENNDGIPDVQQISAEQYSARKFLLVLKTVNPAILSNAFSQIYTIMLAVIATLRVKFVRTISLGVSIGDVLSQTASKFLIPELQAFAPKELHFWIPMIIRYICRMIGTSVAFSLTRILVTIHTAFRGARLATDGVTKIAESRDLHHLTDGYVDDAIAFVFAFIGIYLQIFAWSNLPILFRLLFFPVCTVEWMLSMLVAFGDDISPIHVNATVV